MNHQFRMASLPIRFLTPFPHRPSRRLPNSLRSDILADQKRGQPLFFYTFFHRVRKKGTFPFSACPRRATALRSCVVRESKGVCPLVAGRFEASEKGRQGATRNRSDRWKGECCIPPPRCEEKAKPSMSAPAIPNWCFQWLAKNSLSTVLGR